MILTSGELQCILLVTEANDGDAFTARVTEHVRVATASNGGAIYPFISPIHASPCRRIRVRRPSRRNSCCGTNSIAGTPYAFPDAATGLTAAEIAVGGSRCQGEYETLAISDADGHVINFCYEEQEHSARNVSA